MSDSVVKDVYAAIARVSAEIAKSGISKDKRNAQQGYNFRGIDDVYNALAPILAAQGLVILPRIVDRSVVERTTQKGGVLFYVTIIAEFDFVAASDGSLHTVRTYGEAMDSGDKATNKAMSAAYKYAAFQAFCIPTEGDNDADATTHEVSSAPAIPLGYDQWLTDLESVSFNGTVELQAAWKASRADFRKYLTSTNKEHWERIKAKAAENEPVGA